MITLHQGDTRLEIDPGVGNLPLWEVLGRRPLHAAPWRDEAEVQDASDIPAVNKRLAGDFLCAPFGRDDVENDPPHGRPANCPWDLRETGAAHAHLVMENGPRGARIDKHVRIDGPVLYQRHILTGGAGKISLAHHPMTRMAAGGRLSFSPKRAALTDPLPQYEGHNLWSLNQIQPDLDLYCEDGSRWDLHAYPAAHKVEDFAILVEAQGRDLGWTVVMREAEDDMLVVLKDARILPVTMLWISNGGRDFAPWNGRHTGVLGVEDGCAAGALGLAQSMGENRVSAMGVPTTLDLGGTHTIRHAMISLPRPPGWARVTDLRLESGQARLTEAGGGTLTVPFDAGFFA